MSRVELIAAAILVIVASVIVVVACVRPKRECVSAHQVEKMVTVSALRGFDDVAGVMFPQYTYTDEKRIVTVCDQWKQAQSR